MCNPWRWVAVGVAALAVAPATASAQTFTYSGSEQTYSVPAGVTGVHVVLVGAAGSPADLGIATGGSGARLAADIPVSPRVSALYVEVGGIGTGAYPPSLPYSATGGWNGGGGGPFGGGGATDVRTVSCGSAADCATGGSQSSLASRLAVAGGGGAASTSDQTAGLSDGGSAGNSDGSGLAGDTILSGIGATTTAAGPADGQVLVTTQCTGTGGAGGEVGLAGSLGAGGTGAYLLISGPNSGGGGAGIYGGGGGAQCYQAPGTTASPYAGAGGGGSSGAPGGQDISITTDITDPPEAIITAPFPTHTAAPTLRGSLTVGDVLTEDHGAWASSLPISRYTYQWERCDTSGASCTAVGGATGRTYTLQHADFGHTLRVQETASNFYGQASAAATSQPSGAITARAAPGTNPAPGTTRSGRSVLSRLRVSPPRLSVAGRRVNRRCVRPTHHNSSRPRCRRPIKLKISYSLTAAVKITFTVTKTVSGRIVNGRCVKAAAKTRRRETCPRFLAVHGKIIRAGRPGAHSFVFNGRLSGRTLGYGTYKLTATPSRGRHHTTTFKILR